MSYNTPRSPVASLSFKSYIEFLGGVVIYISKNSSAGTEIKNDKIVVNSLILLNGQVLIPHKDYKLANNALSMNFDLYSGDDIAILPFQSVENSNHEDLFRKDL
jgi:hypothetical protein